MGSEMARLGVSIVVKGLTAGLRTGGKRSARGPGL